MAAGASCGHAARLAPSQLLIFATLNTIQFVHTLLTTEGLVVEWMWWAYVPLFASFALGSAYFLKKDGKLFKKAKKIPATRSKSPAKAK